MSVRGDRSKARHGGHQERTGHGAAGQGGDRRAQRVRGPTRAAVAPQKAQAARTGLPLYLSRHVRSLFT